MANKTRHGRGCAICIVKDRDCKGFHEEGRCTSCISKLVRGVNDTRRSIGLARDLDRKAVLYEIRKKIKAGTLLTLDAEGTVSNSLTCDFITSDSRNIKFALQITGPFTTNDPTLMEFLDPIILAGFSTGLSATTEPVDVIQDATLAGGYIALVCSINSIVEETHTSLDSGETPNEFMRYNLGVHLKALLVCRMQELVSAAMNGIRCEHTAKNHEQHYANAYGATVILYSEVHHFKESLKKNGYLHDNTPKNIRSPLVDWFTSLEHELMQLLGEGCGRYPFWMTTITGNPDELRREEETYALSLLLERRKTTPQAPQESWNTSADSNAQISYLSTDDQFYNPATMQGGPRAMVDSRYQSNNGWYADHYNS